MRENFTANGSSSTPTDSETVKGKAKNYQAYRNRLYITGLGLSLGGLLLCLWTGWTFLFKDWALALSGHPAAAVFFYFLFFSLYFFVLEFPLAFYSGHVIERRFGLSNQSLRSWLGEELKRELLSFLFFLALVEALYFFLRTLPQTWWLVAWAGWLGVTVLLGKFWHLLILPLFYKSVRLNEGVLRSKILEFVRKNGFSVRDVYVVNLSKSTRKANAAFTGLGSTRRVLLADTLVENFTPNEVESVVAHELGHARKRHVLKGILYNTLTSFAVFYVAQGVLNAWSEPLGFDGPHDIAAFPLLGLVAFAMGLFLMPLGNLYSRHHETQADDFALAQCPDRSVFVSALEKLGRMNLADFEPHPIIEFFLYSHPSLGKRIRRAQSS